MNISKNTLLLFIFFISTKIVVATGINETLPSTIGFTENIGQLLSTNNIPANEIIYYSEFGNMGIYISRDKLYYILKRTGGNTEIEPSENDEIINRNLKSESIRVELKLLNCNAGIVASAYDKQSFKSNYFLPQCPNGISASNYKKIKLENVYSGINWILYLKEENGKTVFKYDFEILPGADISNIKLEYSGASKISKSNSGEINVETPFGNISDGKPFSYSELTKKAVSSNFTLSNNVIGFDLKNYNKKEKIIIDPTVLWSTYFGYNFDEHGRAIAVGIDGCVYAAGFSNSTGFQALNGYSSPVHAGFDAFVMKLSPALQPIWITYYGGSLADVCRSIDIDSAGNVFAGFETRSADMPTFNAYQPAKNDTDDFFIAKFDSSGIPIWASFYGGNNLDAFRRLKIINDDFCLISGYSKSTDFPMINPIQATNAGDADIVLMKLNLTTGLPFWSTYFGGSGYDEGVGVSIDKFNNIFLVGTTKSINFPVLNAFQTVLKGASDIFVLKINSSHNLLWSTYIGSTMDDDGNGIALDTSGNCFIIGTTKKNNYPILNAWQTVYKSPSDAVISKFNGNGNLVWSTYAGGPGTEDGNSIAVDKKGNVLATGYSLSTTFPLLNATQPVFGGQRDAYILRFNNYGNCLYSSYYGGNGIEQARGITVDNSNNAFVIGSTTSTNLPLINPLQSFNGTTSSSGGDCFILKINYSLSLSPEIYFIGNNPKCILTDSIQIFSNSVFQNVWSNGETTQNINVTEPANYFVTAYDSTGIGISSDTIHIQNSVLADFEYDSSVISNICYNSIINLNAPIISGANYLWISNNGYIYSSNNLNINLTQDTSLGIYTCIATVGTCSKTVRKVNLLNLFSAINPVITASSTLACVGNQIILQTDSIPGIQYLWNGPNGFIANTRIVSLNNVQTLNSGEYFVKFILNGCESLQSSVDIIISSMSMSNAGPDLIACNGINKVNMAGVNTINGMGLWSCTTTPPVSFININDANTLVTNLKVGTNQLSWTVNNGTCPPAIDLVNVKYTTAANFGCTKPSNLSQIISSNMASLNWSNCTIAEQFQVRITLNGAAFTISTTNYNLILNNLNPGTYTWKVRPKCNGVWSAYSLTKTFNITASAKSELVNISENNFILFPNPANDKLNVLFELIEPGEYNIELIDVMGRILLSKSQFFDEGKWLESFNISTVSKGIYFVRITNFEQPDIINKFIKE